MKVLILAGGKGTRLLPLTKYHPKVLASVHGKPFLYYLLKLYSKHDKLLSIGYKKDSIKDWCRSHHIWLEYVEEETPLGHSGAIINAQPFLSNCKMFAVVNGDTYHDINIDKIKKNFLKDKPIARKIYATNILTKKPDGCGIYLFKQECFKYFRKGIHTDDMLRCVPTAKIYLNNNYYLDIGSHEGLKYAKQSNLLREIQ